MVVVVFRGGNRILDRLTYYLHERVSYAPRWHGAMRDCNGRLELAWDGRDPVCTEAVLQAVLSGGRNRGTGEVPVRRRGGRLSWGTNPCISRTSPPLVSRLGVLGWPVAHSRSPAIHNAALEAVGLSGWRYQLLPVPPALFEETVRALPAAGLRGANVTIPHKEAALALAGSASDSARAIGAANTLLFEPGGRIQAENTDAPAILASLPFSPAGRTALVLGAGGSARAAVWALLDAGAREVRVWNRTPDRARALCAEIGGTPVADAEPADILVHCTSSGLATPEDMFKDLPLDADHLSRFRCVVDLVYAERDTHLVRAARARSLPVVDGLAILVAQGALAFERFTGVPAPPEVMAAAVGSGTSQTVAGSHTGDVDS